MAGDNLNVWYDPEGDHLEIVFDQKAGYFEDTSLENVMRKRDAEGNLLAISIFNLSSFTGTPDRKGETHREGGADTMATSVNTPTMSAVKAGVKRPRRLHHAAWVTRDSEATRHFYEDILGLPLVATWAERAPTAGGGTREYVHTFFAFADGGALAFFQHADQDERPIDLNSPGHLAFECDAETQQGIKDRLEANGYALRLTDHGYCVSLYVTDPNNLRLEFTVDHADLPRINAHQMQNAHADLARWLAGDHTPNNDIRPH